MVFPWSYLKLITSSRRLLRSHLAHLWNFWWFCFYQHRMILNNHIQDSKWTLMASILPFPIRILHVLMQLPCRAMCLVRSWLWGSGDWCWWTLKALVLISYPQIVDFFLILLATRYLQDFALLLLKRHCHILVSSVSLPSDKLKLGLS